MSVCKFLCIQKMHASQTINITGFMPYLSNKNFLFERCPHIPHAMSTQLLGRTVHKEFYVSGNSGVKRRYRGKIIGCKRAWTSRGKLTNIMKFRVRYQDGDEEDLLLEDIHDLWLLAETSCNKDEISENLA
jgi:hypothetical protein